VVVSFSKYHEVTFENVLILHFIIPFDKQIYVERLLILSTSGVLNEAKRKSLKIPVSET